MQFVPTIDFGAVARGVAQGQKDWHEWEMMPLERDLKQAQLDNAQLDLAEKGQTSANRIAALNSRLIFSDAQNTLNTDLLNAGRPGSLALAGAQSRAREANAAVMTPELLRSIASARADTMHDQVLLGQRNAEGALGRAGTTNALADVQVENAWATAQQDQNLMPQRQELLRTQLATSLGMAQDQLARLPQTLQTSALQSEMAYRQLQQAGVSMDVQAEALKMRSESMAKTREYSEVLSIANDGVKLREWIAQQQANGVTFPDENAARIALDNRAQTLGREAMALQGGIANLLRANELSNQDVQNGLRLAGRTGPGGVAAGAGTPGNPFAVGEQAGAAHPLVATKPPPDKAEPPKIGKDMPLDLLKSQPDSIAKRKEIDRRNIVDLQQYIEDQEKLLGPAYKQTPQDILAINQDIYAAQAKLDMIKEKQKTEKEMLKAPRRIERRPVPTLIGE